MHTTVSSIAAYLRGRSWPDLAAADLRGVLDALIASREFVSLVDAFVGADVFANDFAAGFAQVGALDAVPSARALHGAPNLPLRRLFAALAQVVDAFGDDVVREADRRAWRAFARRFDATTRWSNVRLVDYGRTYLPTHDDRAYFERLAARLEREVPQALYPTSDYRASSGAVASSADGLTIEAVMHQSTSATVKIVDRSLDLGETTLRDVYRPFGRCVCIVDSNVDMLYGTRLEAYFAHHGIALQTRAFRAAESDKSIATVERMLGTLKALGVSRDEPVLVVGGGVLADTAGLACALYARNTPYVMLSTSIVTAIDAGPSPRTCCDGYGYKNLFGAYHPPVLSITDRYFFETLASGWLRHGIAEIVKMSVVKDAALFADLEAARGRLIETRFGTTDCDPNDPIQPLARKILSGALRAYVAVEYDNLYETHQCRPHAYGHTWSPGFEIEAGLLHGHAVAICMGLGAYVSKRLGWIDDASFHRILRLMSDYGLSLRHDVLDRRETMWQSQRSVVQKRGGNLVAPLPKGPIGNCGYLNELSRADLESALDEYEAICARYPRAGYGIDAHCDDVGLERPGVLAALTTA